MPRVAGPIGGGGAGSGATVNVETYTAVLGVAVGDAVYLSAANTVDKADATDDTKSPAVGFVQSMTDPTTAVVQFAAQIGGFAGLTPTLTVFLDTAPGAITQVAPSTPGNVIQELGFAVNATTVMIVLDRDLTIL